MASAERHNHIPERLSPEANFYDQPVFAPFAHIADNLSVSISAVRHMTTLSGRKIARLMTQAQAIAPGDIPWGVVHGDREKLEEVYQDMALRSFHPSSSHNFKGLLFEDQVMLICHIVRELESSPLWPFYIDAAIGDYYKDDGQLRNVLLEPEKRALTFDAWQQEKVLALQRSNQLADLQDRRDIRWALGIKGDGFAPLGNLRWGRDRKRRDKAGRTMQTRNR